MEEKRCKKCRKPRYGPAAPVATIIAKVTLGFKFFRLRVTLLITWKIVVDTECSSSRTSLSSEYVNSFRVIEHPWPPSRLSPPLRRVVVPVAACQCLDPRPGTRTLGLVRCSPRLWDWSVARHSLGRPSFGEPGRLRRKGQI